MTTMVVSYAGDAGTPFDRDTYVGTHLPLVLEAWGTYGLKTATAFFPSNAGAGTIAICLCVFSDEAALRAALGSPEAARVMADIQNFTSVTPQRFLLAAL